VYYAGAAAEVTFDVTVNRWRAYRLGDWPTLRLNAVLKALADP
jgi:hypothetical protein